MFSFSYIYVSISIMIHHHLELYVYCQTHALGEHLWIEDGQIELFKFCTNGTGRYLGGVLNFFHCVVYRCFNLKFYDNIFCHY